MNLKNKIIVITGSTKGLGKALAVAFLEEKAKVTINARSKKELKEIDKEIGTNFFYVGDVTKEGDMKGLASFAVKKFRRIDIWINNAGIVLPHSPIEEINSQKAHQVMEVNFWGTFYGSRAAMKVMKKQKNGTILNIISSSSLIGRPLSAVYAASKWATRGFTKSLYMALKPKNISVIAVHPEGIKTSIFGKFKPVGYDNWMEPSYVANKIIQNLKRQKPKAEIIIKIK